MIAQEYKGHLQGDGTKERALVGMNKDNGCMGCSICCFITEIKETASPLGKWCRYCTGDSCTNYEGRPEECRSFYCAWANDEGAHESLRPDRLKCMFEYLDVGTIIAHQLIGFGVSPLAWGQVENFVKGGTSVVCVRDGELHLFIPAFGDTAARMWGRIDRKLNDSAKLHN